MDEGLTDRWSLIFCYMEIPEAGWKDRILFILGRRDAFQVQGDSMKPTLNDGEVVLIKYTRSIRVSDVVVAKHPFKKSVRMIKRVADIDGQGRCLLTGDNPDESTDGRTFGSIPRSDILGRIVGRLKDR